MTIKIINTKGCVEGCYDGSLRINVSHELFCELREKGLIHKRVDEGLDRWVYTITPRECLAAGYRIRLPNGMTMGISLKDGKYIYYDAQDAAGAKRFDSIGEMEKYIASGAHREA